MYHFTSVKTAIIKTSTKTGDEMDKREPSYIVGRNINWYSRSGEEYWGSLKKLKIELPYDPAIPLLDIYPDKTIIQKYTCTPVFIAAPFTIARTWKQSECPSTQEWKKLMQYIYTMEYYSAIKRNKIMPLAATQMDLEIATEWSKPEKNTYHLYIIMIYNIIYMWNLKKNGTHKPIYKTESQM